VLFSRFEKTISEYKMFSEGDGVVAAISGGSDSVCMLHLLCRVRENMGIKIYVAHINHMIRPTASRDEAFVKNLCEKWNIPFYSLHKNVAEIAKQEKISTELCGRNIRYAFFEEVLNKTGSRAVLTAHNKNDNAETFLMHLLRGSGSGGLSGILPVRDNICRPLLDFTKEEIENYLKEHNVPWVEDETNALSLYTRNIIRNEIMPLIKKINPSAEDAILKASCYIKEDDNFLNSLADKADAVSEKGINLEKFSSLPHPLQKRVIIKALKNAGFEVSAVTIAAISSLADKQSGKSFVFPCGGKAVKEYGEIVFLPPEENTDFSYEICVGEKIYLKETEFYVSLQKEKPSPPYLKLNKQCTKLNVRPPLAGDKFSPSGMSGHKKLSDFFADCKIPKTQRKKIPVFLCEGKIAAVGSLRADNDFLPLDGEDIIYLKISEV